MAILRFTGVPVVPTSARDTRTGSFASSTVAVGEQSAPEHEISQIVVSPGVLPWNALLSVGPIFPAAV